MLQNLVIITYRWGSTFDKASLQPGVIATGQELCIFIDGRFQCKSQILINILYILNTDVPNQKPMNKNSSQGMQEFKENFPRELKQYDYHTCTIKWRSQ